MKKLVKVLFVLLISLSSYSGAKATHMMGSDLTWKCVGQDSFLIKLVVYRDCNGVYLSSTPITFTCATTGATITSLSIGVGTPVDITPVCNSSCTRCQSTSCSFPYGIHRFTMQGIVKLSGAGSCCSIRISWEQAARNSNITTGAADQNFYIEAKLNRCQNPCDNSPTFTNAPIAILCVGQDFTFNHGVQDVDVNSTGGLADSLTYEWAEPLATTNSPIPYLGSYTYDKAIYFWGFPNDALPFPRGIHLDPQSGDIQFRPMKAEVTIMVIKVNEFRNGVKIAEIRRDLQIIVIQCTNNNPPTIMTPNNVRSKNVCAGDAVTFNFTTSDPNAPDTVTISWNNAIPGATWTQNNGLAKLPSGSLTWTPTDANVSSLPYTFTVTAKDNACPVRASFTQAYQITVKPKPRANIVVSDSGCGIFWFMAQRIEGSGPVYSWIGGSFVFSPKQGALTTHKFQPGKYPYTMTMVASGCSNTYFDTVKVDTFIVNNLPKDTNVCYGSTITLNSRVKYNKGPITMVWGSRGTVFGSNTGLSKTLTVTKDTVIWSRASDTIVCSDADTIHINMHKQPVVNLGPDVRICSYGEADIKVSYQIDEGKKRSITWTDLKTNSVVDRDTMLSTSDSSLYRCMVVDTFNCIGYDTVRVIKNPEVIASVLGQTICYGEQAELDADPTGGGNAQYLWYEGSKLIGGSRKLKIKPIITTDYWLKVSETISGVKCKDSMMVRVLVNSLPVIKITAIDKRCINGSIISLNNFVTVNGGPKSGGKWSSPSAGLINPPLDRFQPIAAGVSTPPGWKVVYEYTDPATGCYSKDSGYVTINALPKPYAGIDSTICTGAPISLYGVPQIPPGTWRGTGVEGNYPNWRFNPDATGIVNGGTYGAIYHYIDNNQCENEDTIKITVFKTPVADAGNPKEFCIDAGSITLTGDPAGGTWTGQGVAGNQFYPSLASPGVHDLTYTYTNVKCTATDKVKYTVWDLPVVLANTVSGKTYFCRNDGLVQLKGQPGGAGGIWSGPGVSGSTFNPAIGADAKTDYSLRYEYTDNHKCKNRADLLVTVKPEPVVVIDPAGNRLCFGNPYTISATYNHADGVTWWKDSQSDGNIVGDPDSASISYDPGPNDRTKLYFWLHIKTIDKTDNICAPAYDSIQVYMSAMPEPAFSGDPLTGCSKLTVHFSDSSTINPGTISTWEWSFGDGNMSGNQNPVHEYQLPGKYDVKLKVISDAKCEKELLKPEYIEAYIVPTANFIPKPALALLSVPTIEFLNMTTNQTPLTTYLWNFGDYGHSTDGGSSTLKDPSYKYSDTGHYQVILIASNEFGCADTMPREVVIMPDVIVYIPNAFTPGNTGPPSNNIFKAYVQGVMSFEIKIYDRWGQLMYQSDNLETHGWPGTYLGSAEMAPMDVYVYTVKVKGLDGIDYKYTGSVSLLR